MFGVIPNFRREEGRKHRVRNVQEEQLVHREEEEPTASYSWSNLLVSILRCKPNVHEYEFEKPCSQPIERDTVRWSHRKTFVDLRRAGLRFGKRTRLRLRAENESRCDWFDDDMIQSTRGVSNCWKANTYTS